MKTETHPFLGMDRVQTRLTPSEDRIRNVALASWARLEASFLFPLWETPREFWGWLLRPYSLKRTVRAQDACAFLLEEPHVKASIRDLEYLWRAGCVRSSRRETYVERLPAPYSVHTGVRAEEDYIHHACSVTTLSLWALDIALDIGGWFLGLPARPEAMFESACKSVALWARVARTHPDNKIQGMWRVADVEGLEDPPPDFNSLEYLTALARSIAQDAESVLHTKEALWDPWTVRAMWHLLEMGPSDLLDERFRNSFSQEKACIKMFTPSR